MMGSLFSAVSGLKAHQQRMDVIGNNIANVNTPGFKRSRVTFQDMLNQTIRGASRPVEGGRGGTNPIQSGPGVIVASIDTLYEGSNLQNTGKATDLGINGDGFFVLSDGKRKVYTRVGNFDFDSEGSLVSLLNGMRVQGWMAADGVINIGGMTGDIQIPSYGVTVKPKATQSVVFTGNLDARVNGLLKFKSGTNTDTFIIKDGSTNNSATMQLTFTPTNSFNTWDWAITAVSGGTITSGGSGTVTLDSAGKVSAVTGDDVEVDVGGGNNPDITIKPPAPGDDPNNFTLLLEDPLDSIDPSNPIDETVFTPAETRAVRQTVYDSLGTMYTLTVDFERQSNSTWKWEASVVKETEEGPVTISLDADKKSGGISFDSEGKFITSSGATIIAFDPGNGADHVEIVPKFENLYQHASYFSAMVLSQDGYQEGRLESYTFDSSGTIMGVFSNGVTQNLAQVVLARFANPAGLMKWGNSLFSESSNSGQALLGPAGTEGYGTINPGSLEMSNVDLSSEFTDMITTQRGFQANSRVITASDEMLQELVNLKR